MKRLSLIVLILSFTFAAPVTAADKDGLYSIQGDVSCGDWVKGRKDDRWLHVTYINWIVGYITAYNELISDVFDILGSTDMESVYLWMDKYCQENPLSKLAYGMEYLTNELWPNRKRTKDEEPPMLTRTQTQSGVK